MNKYIKVNQIRLTNLNMLIPLLERRNRTNKLLKPNTLLNHLLQCVNNLR